MKKAELREGEVGAVRLCPHLLNLGRMREQRGEEEKVGLEGAGLPEMGLLDDLETNKLAIWDGKKWLSIHLYLDSRDWVWPRSVVSESQLYHKCCVTSHMSLNISGLRSTSNRCDTA